MAAITVRVTKVMGHAKDVDVQQGRARLVDQHGNAEADAAADLGRRHQSEALLDARRRLFGARSHWYPSMTDLHRFMIAVVQVSVNHDGEGGTAPDPLVWDQGSRPKARKLAIRVNVDLASLPGPPGFLSNSWVQVDAGRITGSDIAAWLYRVGILGCTSFRGTLHWPSASVDLGHFGISFLELFILFEEWAGHRLYPILLDLHRFVFAVARFLSIMMGEVVLSLIPLFGIMAVGQNLVSLLFGLMSILPLFLALLVS